MSALYDITVGTMITPYATMEQTQNVLQIKQRSIDGTVYIQTVGTPEKDLSGTVYVDREGKAALDTAHANGDLLEATLKHGTYYGRLISVKYGKRMAGDTFAAEITLAQEETE